MGDIPKCFVGATEERCRDIVECFWKIVLKQESEENHIDIPVSVTAELKSAS